MEIKLIEIRDSGTFIPAMAVKFKPNNEQERYLLARAGYGTTPEQQEDYVLLWTISGEYHEATCDVYRWDNRTMQVAHHYLIQGWDDIVSGDVVDVQYILNESGRPKESERHETP